MFLSPTKFVFICWLSLICSFSYADDNSTAVLPIDDYKNIAKFEVRQYANPVKHLVSFAAPPPKTILIAVSFGDVEVCRKRFENQGKKPALSIRYGTKHCYLNATWSDGRLLFNYGGLYDTGEKTNFDNFELKIEGSEVFVVNEDGDSQLDAFDCPLEMDKRGELYDLPLEVLYSQLLKVYSSTPKLPTTIAINRTNASDEQYDPSDSVPITVGPPSEQILKKHQKRERRFKKDKKNDKYNIPPVKPDVANSSEECQLQIRVGKPASERVSEIWYMLGALCFSTFFIVAGILLACLHVHIAKDKLLAEDVGFTVSEHPPSSQQSRDGSAAVEQTSAEREKSSNVVFK